MKTIENDHYTYRVTWSEDDNEYVGLCAEFHSVSWLDKTPENALRGMNIYLSQLPQKITVVNL